MLNTRYIDNVLLHLSAKCNCNCSHCYVKPFCELPSIENAIANVISVLKQIHKPVHITGGEVMFLHNFEEWVSELLRNEIDLTTIYSNGTLIRNHKKFLQELHASHPNIRFIISLDGVKDTHCLFRRSDRQIYDKTLQGAAFLKEIGFRVFINTMLHSQMKNDDLNKLHAVILENHFDRWRIDRPFAMGNWVDNYDMHICWEKSFALFSHIVKLWCDSGLPYDLEINHTFKYLNSKITVFDKYSLGDPICPCRAFPIWPNGDVTWCQILHDKNVIGNIFSTPMDVLVAAYNRYKMKRISDFVSGKKCEKCELLPYCGAGCRANSMMSGGTFEDVDPEFCSIFNKQLQKKVLQPLMEFVT